MYYGPYCESKIDFCTNETCAGHGSCMETGNGTVRCECFQFYYGARCDEKEDTLSKIEQTRLASSIIAALCIVLFYAIFVLADVLNLFETFKAKEPVKMKRKSKLKSFRRGRMTNKIHYDYNN